MSLALNVLRFFILIFPSSSDLHSDTHWLRQDVDAFLFREAAAAGAVCIEDCEVGVITSVGRVFNVPLKHGHVENVPHESDYFSNAESNRRFDGLKSTFLQN